jgi:hypothetical protein
VESNPKKPANTTNWLLWATVANFAIILFLGIAVASLFMRLTKVNEILDSYAFNIDTLTTDLSSVASVVDSHASDINLLTSDLGSMASDINLLTSDLGSMASAVNSHASDINALASELGSMASVVNSHASDINALASDLRSVASVASNADRYAHSHTYSDSRLKSNVAEIENSLDRVLQLRAVTFTWNDAIYPDLGLETGDDYGLLAQELAVVFPELVALDEQSGFLRVDYEGLVPILIQAIQEQQIQIDELRESLATQ